MKPANILLVDDDRNFLKVLTHQVKSFGHQPYPAASGKEALKKVKEEPIDVVVTDLRMPEMDGLELLERLQERRKDLPIIVLTAHGSISKAIEATRKGAFDFLTKPCDSEEVRLAVGNAVRLARLLVENRRLAKVVDDKFQFEGIVGTSKSFQETLSQARQLSEVDTTVLIQGETGTGKELLARAIHFNSPRRKQPFVVVNCGAIPRDLIESELFGYRKGAFTGAVSNKKGKVEAADSGTLFLDEVGELPTDMQVKLLRLLQEREIDVVGAVQPRPVDIRVLAATNRDLGTQMREGKFREDLYYRLCVAPLFLPPLRERREDIPLLVHHILEKLHSRLKKEVTLDESVVLALQRYRWPGNIRELENILERIAVFSSSNSIGLQDLPAELRHPTETVRKVAIELPEDGFSLEDLERDILVMALERHGWNQTQAARYLNLTRNTLIYRMQKFNLKRDG